jgi:hypothetical protein
MYRIRIESLPGLFSIYRYSINEKINYKKLFKADIMSVTKTLDEVSIVCRSEIEIPGAEIDPDWRVMRITGQLDTSLVGILYRMTAPLKAKGVSVFVISTFDTDYLMVKREKFHLAIDTLNAETGITAYE